MTVPENKKASQETAATLPIGLTDYIRAVQAANNVRMNVGDIVSGGADGLLSFVSVKDARFGAVGDGTVDDTVALQACADYCFGSASSPHGASNAKLNKVMYLPQGTYRVTAPILFTKVVGGRIIGAGRFVTTVRYNSGVLSQTPVFKTNGFAYSHVEGITFTGCNQSTIFQLDWDGTAGGSALQSNTFYDCFFDGSSRGAIYGITIGNTGFMGSENLFVNCFWNGDGDTTPAPAGNAYTGLFCGNANALQQTVIGGNFQACGAVAIDGAAGSCPTIQGVGFQQNGIDIKTGSLAAYNTYYISGCRTESPNFVNVATEHCVCISGCSQISALGPGGYFLHATGGQIAVTACTTSTGAFELQQSARVSLTNVNGNLNTSSFFSLSNMWYVPSNSVDFTLELQTVWIGDAFFKKERWYSTDGSTVTKKSYTIA